MTESQKNMKNVTNIMEVSQEDYRKKMANQAQEIVEKVKLGKCKRRTCQTQQ